jgi:L-2-hydroxyglutarate oxidase LhgO
VRYGLIGAGALGLTGALGLAQRGQNDSIELVERPVRDLES